jgi:hypothetical protein
VSGGTGPGPIRWRRGSEILVGTGRRVAVGGIGLGAIGLDADGPIDVDASVRAAGDDWLYAVGDVNGRDVLTHMSKSQARVCGSPVRAVEYRMGAVIGASCRLRATPGGPSWSWTRTAACSSAPRSSAR